MTKSLDDMVAKRPVDRGKVDAHKKEMLEGVRSYRLRELGSDPGRACEEAGGEPEPRVED